MELLKLVVKDRFLFSFKVFQFTADTQQKWIYVTMKEKKTDKTRPLFFFFLDHLCQITGKVSKHLVSSPILRPVAVWTDTQQTALKTRKYRLPTHPGLPGWQHMPCASGYQLINCSQQSLLSPTPYTQGKWNSERLCHLPKNTQQISRVGI